MGVDTVSAGGELSRVDGIDHRPGVLQLDATAHSIPVAQQQLTLNTCHSAHKILCQPHQLPSN